MLRFLLKKPHRTAGAAVALLSAIAAAGDFASFSNPPDYTSASLSISLPLRNLWKDIGIASTFPISAGGLGFPSQHQFVGSTAPPTDADKDDCKCGKGCMSKNSIANAASVVSPAVVNISISQGFGRGIGSGTIIDPDGTILTCAHVVADFHNGKAYNKGNVTVMLQDGRNFEGRVVNADHHSDVAIVKIKSNTPLPSARFGNSANLRPGDWVVALGCPLSLQNTITAGIVSCVNRKGSDLGFEGVGREFIQTDCAINQGNSGGPLVNLDGEIVGMNVMKVMAADGLSFAVPIDVVAKIMEHFRKRGKVMRPWLGLKMLDLNAMIISQLKERDQKFPDVDRGILVPMVIPGSPGDRAGFRANDVVVSFDGKPVESINEIVHIMGDRVGVPLRAVVVRRGNKYVNLTVVPEEAKSS
ncbi:trypsin family protein with PDZ domain-containing protein isoform X2 [Carex rostrata]